MKIGITAPGSSTHFMVQYLMARHRLKADDAAFIGVGTGPSAIAAARRGEIDAIVNVDPVIAVLESQGLIRVVADTRTPEGTREVFGGPYPAAVLYATAAFVEKNPRTVQALVNAFVRGLKWIQGQSPEEIARVMPEEYALGDRALYVRSIRNSLPTFSPDGRFTLREPRSRTGCCARSIRTSAGPRSTWPGPTPMPSWRTRCVSLTEFDDQQLLLRGG